MEAEPPIVYRDKPDIPEIANFDPTRKKKKKKKAVVLQCSGYGSIYNVDPAEDTRDHLGTEGEEGAELKCPWSGSDRDYGYEELLHRVYSILNENNPELNGDKRRIVMKPPQVLQEGTGRTLFVNFKDICDIVRRQPDHLVAFLLAEIGTSGYLDRQQRLVFRGRYTPKNVEAIIRRYIDEYVLCSVCRSPDTILSKDRNLFTLGCNLCGFEQSLASNKAGHMINQTCEEWK